MRSKVFRISLISLMVLSAVTVAALLAMSITGTEIRAQATEQIAGLRDLTAQPYVEAYNQHNLIRFHVIANSDSDRDQALKRRVRDLIVQRMSPEFAKAQSLDEARQIAKAHLEDIRQIAKNEVSSSGEKYAVTVQLGKFDFPIKNYGKLTLPAGSYEAVRVVIGQGQGANWWCVLFPPLCFVDVSRAMSPVEEQVVDEIVYAPESEPAFETNISIENSSPGDSTPENSTLQNSTFQNGSLGMAALESPRIKIKFKILELFGW